MNKTQKIIYCTLTAMMLGSILGYIAQAAHAEFPIEIAGFTLDVLGFVTGAVVAISVAIIAVKVGNRD